MTNDEADALEPGLYRITWNDAHRASLGLVLGPRAVRRFGSPHRMLATERSVAHTDAWDTRNPWPRVESVEKLDGCATPGACEIRRDLHARSKPARVALEAMLTEHVASFVRDAFLEGRDPEALGALATELGFVQLASPHPVWRDLRAGDPVVVVSYGRIAEVSTGHGRCYGVALYSEGLGYGTHNEQNPRYVWLEADELRFAKPPEHLRGRVGPAEVARIEGIKRDAPAEKLTLPTFSWAELSDSMRLELIRTCCTTCGALKLPHPNCGCAAERAAHDCDGQCVER